MISLSYSKDLPGGQIDVSVVARTRARVELRTDYIQYVMGNRKLKYEQVKTLIQGALDEALETTIVETEIWIDVHVADRTGALIKSLLRFLAKSRPPPSAMGDLKGIRLILGVGAEIRYAQYVNKMTTAQVRHMGTPFEHSGKRAYVKGVPVYLDDPRAIGFFFDKMVDFAKERLVINLAKAKYKLQNTTKITSRNLSQLQVS